MEKVNVEIVNDIDIETLEAIKKGTKEFARELIKNVSRFSEFREDLAKIAIALSTDKYRILNPSALRGIKRDKIRTILFVYNCFNGTRAIIKTKDNKDRILKIEPIIDKETEKLVELMKAQYDTLQKRFNEEKEELRKEIDEKEKKMKELKEFVINHMLEKEDIDGLKKLLYFYGTEDDIRYAIELAKEEGKDIYRIAKKIAEAIEPELVVYSLYQIDKEKAESLLLDLGIDPEEFEREIEIEA